VDNGLSISVGYYYSGQDEAVGNVVTELPKPNNDYYAEIKYTMTGATGGSDIETAFVTQGLTVGNLNLGLAIDANTMLATYTFASTSDEEDYTWEAVYDTGNFKVTAVGSNGDMTVSADFAF